MGLLNEPLVRRDDWPERLHEAIEAVRGRPYALGDNDCLRLACAVVAGMTGVDFWPRFAGYRTKRQALARIARIAPSLAEAVTATLQVAPAPLVSARRGDLVLFRDEAGEDHLGICLGARVALLGEGGLLMAPADDRRLLCSWRIG